MNPSPTHERVRAIDWLRGIAVLFMIQCHALVLLRPELRQSHTTKLLLKLDGLVAPAFLFSAGFALAMLLVRSAAGGRRGVCLVLLGLVGLEWRTTSTAAPSRVRRFVETFGTSSLSAYFFHEALLYFRVFGFSFQVVWGHCGGWGRYALLTGVLIGLTYGLCRAMDPLLDAVRRGARTVADTLAGSFGQKFARPR
ncbi:MAG TPA: heparan-alpha-glucosaminide N-acetyltransferase domain-containing protein [Archangium sp.]|jgi:hypothetical protein|uniref:heparan-alpha-glucosaminide N-acetyltransferase domain-containing protein n=1 Tax=Archangium sp. TaxID=1872627 RepID=UPI002ED7CE35